MLGGIVAVLLAAAAADEVTAKEHVEAAERHYRARDFQQAADEYKAAYQLTPHPALLFNLGQAHRQLGHHKEAAFYFGQYLSRLPDAANRPQAEAFLQEERGFLDAPLVPATSQPIVVVEERTREVRVLVEKPWRPTRVASVAAVSVGVVALGVGIAEGVHGKSLSNDLQARVQRNGGALTQQDLATVDSAHGATRTANVLLGVSAVLVVAGAGLWFAF